MQKKWIFLAGTALCLLVAAWLYYQYQKPRAGVAAAAADYTLQAENLLFEFSTNEEKAQQQYAGKVLEVTGMVAEIQQEPNTTIILLKGGESGGINCQMKTAVQEVDVNKMITLKGRCTGYLMDVNLVDGIVIR